MKKGTKYGARKNTFERDNALINILLNHKGRENSISANDLTKEVNNLGFDTNSDAIREAIRRLRYERHTPICFANAKGYYLPTCKADIEAVIADLTSRVEEMTKYAEFLKGFIF